MTAQFTWEASAPCSGMDVSVFFPDPDNENGHVRPEQYDVALDVCDGCPFHAECRALWVETGRPTNGVWFATTPPMRKASRLGTQTKATHCRQPHCGRELTAQQRARRHLYCGPECARKARLSSQAHYDKRKRHA